MFRVIERREDLRLATKACESIRISGHRRVEHLDCDVAVQGGITRAIDLTHPSGSEEAQNVIVSEPTAWDESHCSISVVSADPYLDVPGQSYRQ